MGDAPDAQPSGSDRDDTAQRQTLAGIRSVAIIGAGISGILATRYLVEAGLEVTVFERNDQAGGVWLYDERKAPEPPYSATKPLETALSLCPWYSESNKGEEAMYENNADLIISHAPPGPCYEGLTNNFSLVAMELKDHPWQWEIPMATPECPDHASEWTTHRKILDHIQKASSRFGLEDRVRYRTLVERVRKSGDKWAVKTSTLTPIPSTVQSTPGSEAYRITRRDSDFDAVVIASGHYHTPRLPDIPGLKEWREKHPDGVEHSKSYRSPGQYAGQNVLLVGGGTSSTEIARELAPFARKMYQSGRGTVFDLPLDFIPDNCQRIGEIAEFRPLKETNYRNGSTAIGEERLEHIPGSIVLKDGTILDDIHRVIVCTGYHYAYPFMPELHADHTPSAAVDPNILVTDGTCTLNLHKDMFYIPDPTLAFAGISLFISTFSFFEYQTMAIAAVFAGKASLPSRQTMQDMYAERLAARGPTKFMNARMDEEVSYVDELVEWLNSSDPTKHIEGFSPRWHAVRDAGKLEKIRARFEREKAERDRINSVTI